MTTTIQKLANLAFDKYLFENKLHFRNKYNFEHEMIKLGYEKEDITSAIELTYEMIKSQVDYDAKVKVEQSSLEAQNQSMRLYYAKNGTRGEF